MRTRFLIAPLAASAVLLAGLEARALDIFNLKNSLIQFALEQISTEDFTITAEDVESPGEGVTDLVGVEIADREGVWFRAERMGLQWDASRILSAELVINRLGASGVEVLRAPQGEVEVREDAAIAEDDGEPFDWPRSPITTVVEEMRLERVFVAAGVIAGQSLSFDATGAARDEGDEQSLRLDVTRTDEVSGRIDLAYVRNFADNTLALDLTADEAAGGLVAEMGGLPNDSASRVRLAADGPLTNWGMTLSAVVERVIEAGGEATVDLEGAIAVRAEFTVTPGPQIEPQLAAVLGEQARLDIDVAEDETGLIAIRRGRLSSPALRLDATGSYDRGTGAADLDVDLVGEAALAGLAEGVAFDGFGFDGTVTGDTADLTAEGALRLDGLSTEPADVGAARLATTVRVQGARIDFDIDGGAERLRIDRLGPDLLGEADITAEGVYDAEVLTLSGFTFASQPVNLEARGEVDLGAESAALDYRLTTPDLAPLAAAYDQTAGGRVNVSGAVQGPFTGIRATGEAALEELTFEGESYGDLRLSHDVTAGETVEGRLDLTAEGSRFGPVDADLVFALAGERLDLSEIRATALGTDIDGAVVYRLDSGLADGVVEIAAPDLSPLAAVAGQAVRGSVSGRVGLTPEVGEQTVTLDLSLADVAAMGARLAALDLEGTVTDALGTPAVSARIDASGAGYEDARLASLSGTVEGRDLTGAPALDIDLTLEDAAGFGASAARARLVAAIEDATVLAGVEGTLEAEGLAYEDNRVAGLNAEFTAADALSDAPTGRVTATASGISGPAEVPRADLAADLTGAGESGRLVARITAPTLSAGGAAVADPRAEATVSGPLGPSPGVDATVTTGPVDADGARIASVRLTAALRDLLAAAPSVDARLETGEVEAGPATLSQVVATVKGPLSGLEAALDTEGEADGEPVSLSARARIDAAAAAPMVTVGTLDAAYAGEEMRLNAPLTLRAGEATSIEGIDLALPGGGLTGSATLFASGAQAAIRLALDDLGPLARLAEAPVTGGSVEIAIDADTRRGRAGGTFSVTGSDLAFETLLEGAGTMDTRIDGRWDGRAADLDAEITGDFGDPLTATASLPLVPTGGPAPTVPTDSPLSARLRWAGDVGDFWALVPAAGHVLDGQLDLDLGVGGTLDAPRIEGEIALEDGRYENLDIGTILTGIALSSTIEGDGRLGLDLTARDGASGTVGAEAEISLSEGRVNATLTSRRAVLVRRDDAVAAVSLDIAADGPLDGPDISGSVVVNRAEIRLVNATPPSVATLGEVRIKGAPPPDEEEPAGTAIDLDVTVRAPRDLFVRGRGLDSEWMMSLDVGGTAAAPSITGSIERIRGHLLLIGTRFELETGRVIFAGGRSIDPRLDVELVAQENNVTGGIRVSGQASAPEVGFFSRPVLPEDEVMPRLLFGKPSQSLTGGQAIRLASGLATLLSGTGGVVDQARAAVGLDQLSIDPTEEGADLTLGKNVGDSVFVGAKQSVDGQETRLSVEVEVFENIILDSEVDREGDASVGINWRKDF